MNLHKEQKWFKASYLTKCPPKHQWQFMTAGNLETGSTWHSLQTAQQMEGCPFLIIPLARASSRQHGSFVFCGDTSAALCFSQNACLVFVFSRLSGLSLFQAAHLVLDCLPAVFTVKDGGASRSGRDYVPNKRTHLSISMCYIPQTSS